MAGKTLIIVLVPAILLAAGCGTARKEPPPVASKAPAGRTATPAPRPAPAPATFTSPAAPAPPAPAPATGMARLPSLIDADASWLEQGRLLEASQPGAQASPAVPLFRQAIVLADVRASVVGLSAEPAAEFVRGSLILTFKRGAPEEIAAAVNRVLAVPSVGRLRVVLGG